MKAIAICLLNFFFILACQAQDRYELKVSLQSVKNGLAFLQYNDKEDTLKFDHGSFFFKVETEKPTEAFLLVQPGFDLPVQVILEKGKLKAVEKDGSWNISGSPNNDALTKIRSQLHPYSSQIRQLREQSLSQKDEAQKKTFASLDLLQAKRIAEANLLIRKNTNLAGLLTLKNFYLKQSASSVAQYLEQFNAFRKHPIYKELEAHYLTMNKAEVGKKVAGFSLVDLSGDTVSLANFKGKTVLLDFWFHNCGFCRQMVPALKNIYRDYRQKGFEIISISVDARGLEKEWRNAVKEDESNWSQLWDPEKSQVPLYGIAGYPTMFLVDGNGQLLQQIVGYHSETQFRQILDKFLR